MFPYGSVEGADAALTVFLGVLGGRPSFFKLASSAKTVSPAGKHEVRAVPLVQFRCCLRRLLRWQRSDAIRSGLLRAENTHSCNIFRPHIFLGVAFPIQRYIAESQRVVCVTSMRRAVAFGRSRGLPFAPEGHPASGCRSSVVCSFVERWDDAGVS